MKRRKVSVLPIVFVSCLVVDGRSRGEDHAKFPKELQGYLQSVQSDATAERIKGFERLGNYWSRRPRQASAGFSDTPHTSEPGPRPPATPDDQIEAIAWTIEKGLRDRQENVREAAAKALCAAPGGSPAVISAVKAGLLSDDGSVVWYAGQQAVRTPPELSAVSHRVLELLSSNQLSEYWTASELLGTYAEKAKPYSGRIVDVVLTSSEKQRQLKMYVLTTIALTDEAAQQLVDQSGDLSDDEAGIALIALLDVPTLLRALYEKRPVVIQSLHQSHRLFHYLCQHQYKSNKTREWLSTFENLPPSAMGMLRQRKYIPVIESLEAEASQHQKSLLRACKRACGAPSDESIVVDLKHPVLFRPKSAWPDVDKRRLSPESKWHGDGYTLVMVTGEVRLPDGSHPKSVQLFRTNDAMLLGTRQNDPLPVLYSPENGRFVLYTGVFAAYSIEEGQPEPGPYQTGSALVRIESPNCEPLTIQFFDEMPDVSIRLSAESPFTD